MDSKRIHEIRLAGSGGQGIILASIILAEAAVISGRYAAQTSTYGPEARGGSSKAETLISDRPIGFTKVQHPTFFLAFSQKALDRYGDNLSPDCLVLIDTGMTVPEGISEARVIQAPLSATARDVIGKIQTANIVAVGFINEMLALVDEATMRQAAILHVPRGTEQLNVRAFEEGVRLARDWKKEHGR